MVVAAIGGFTAILAALDRADPDRHQAGPGLFDVSQLGYMFAGARRRRLDGGIFHLITHAFFKALLFLGSGSVIHAVHDEQDMSKMGALCSKIPIIYRLKTDGRLDCLIDTGISPNGLVLDPAEAVLFVAMTRDNAVWRMPFMKDGSVSKVGRFCSMFGPSGPDGMTMDSAGRLFVAHASLGHVFVFAPNGELIARIKSCAGQSCTNVAIGGKDNGSTSRNR